MQNLPQYKAIVEERNRLSNELDNLKQRVGGVTSIPIIESMPHGVVGDIVPNITMSIVYDDVKVDINSDEDDSIEEEVTVTSEEESCEEVIDIQQAEPVIALSSQDETKCVTIVDKLTKEDYMNMMQAEESDDDELVVECEMSADEETEEEEEEEEEELFETSVGNVTYYTNCEMNGTIYSITDEDDIGDVVGSFVNGVAVML
jgi:hypothetical protein